MRNSRSKTIRGLSIAVVVLSILGLLGSLLMLALFAVGGVAAFDPNVQSSVSATFEADPDFQYQLSSTDLSTQDVMGIVGVLMGLGGVYAVWAAICNIISLVAGIIGMRNSDNTEKLGMAFGWAVAGAIVSFLYGNIVICILLVISAVCISRDRKESTAIPYGQPAAYTQMPQYNAAPQPPMGQPQYQQPQYQQPQYQQPQYQQQVPPQQTDGQNDQQ